MGGIEIILTIIGIVIAIAVPIYIYIYKISRINLTYKKILIELTALH